jgi:dTDP-4-amino-4,6-dideoxygalactose transaminase
MKTSRQVNFFDYGAVFAQRREVYLKIFDDVLSRGAFIMQADLAEFERKLADYLGVRHAIGLADGTMALIAGLAAAGVRAGDEVIIPSHTFVASAGAAHFLGAIPVLADCGQDHLVDPESIERMITPKTKAVMPVQLNGRTCRMDEIMGIAHRHELVVVEDSCQSLGAQYKGKFAGTFGAAGAFSFYPAKTLGSFGDGGALVTNDDDIAAKVRLFRDHGRDQNGDVQSWGLNSRLDNVQAAILGHKLDHYHEDIARRRALAALYNEQLVEIEALKLPPGPSDNPEYFDIYQNYEIEADRRDELRDYLFGLGVKTILQWGGRTLHQFPALGLAGDVKNTEELTKRFMLLPLHTALTDDDVLYVCECIRGFHGA